MATKYRLNIRSGYSAPVTIHCSYGDSGEQVTFYIYDGDEILDLTGASVTVHGTRKDGANFGPFACTTSPKNIVKFNIQASMTAVAGSAIAELTIVNEGVSIGTCNFGILVENATFPTGVSYDTDPSVYQDILKYTQTSQSAWINSAVNSSNNYAKTYTDGKIATEKAARESADTALSNRISNLVVNAGGSAITEVVDARANFAGTALTALKDRLDLFLEYDSVDDNEVSLKDKDQNSRYPTVLDSTVYTSDGLPAINKPIATATTTFDATGSTRWCRAFVPVTLTEGYYILRVTGVLDHNVTNTIIRLNSARSANVSDMVKSIDNGIQVPEETFIRKFYISAAQASQIQYAWFGQNTDLGGTVTIEIYNFEQLYWKEDTLEKIVYQPIGQQSYFRAALEDGTAASWGNAFIPLKIAAGRYVIRSYSYSYSSSNVQTMIRFSSEMNINGSSLVKLVINATGLDRERVYYVDITDEEAAQIVCLSMSQKTNNIADFEFAIFPADQLYWEVDDLANVLDGLPSYYTDNDWLSNRINTINNRSTIHGVMFPFITDLHFKANALNSKYLLKNILEHTPCSMVVCGGDFAPAYGTTEDLQYTYNKALEYAGFVGHDKWFSVVGNHDFHITDSAESGVRTNWTWGKTYGAVIKPSERWQINSESTGGYYCIDNEAIKTRFIMLNTTEPVSGTSSADADGTQRFNNTQLAWLSERLSELSNYHIIVVSHITSDSTITNASFPKLQAILEAFKNKTTYSDSASGVNVNYANTTNELVCHISGHEHEDLSNVSNNVLSIVTTCDAYYQDDGYGATVGTVTEQAFDVFCIDYDAKSIYTVRIGRGSNRSWTYV